MSLVLGDFETPDYVKQINNMIKEGDLSLDPRTRILTDLRQLITEARSEGFRPILMMDANDEWLDTGKRSSMFNRPSAIASNVM